MNPNKMSTGAYPCRAYSKHKNSTGKSLDDIGLPKNGNNVSAGSADVNDGGMPGKAKQPKKHIGNMTEMGGDNERAATIVIVAPRFLPA